LEGPASTAEMTANSADIKLARGQFVAK
jgi:hypothetical protein